jgi:hypothetical protein
MPKPRQNKDTRGLQVLLRDAQPTRREIDDEPDGHKRRERERARDTAIDVLIRIVRTKRFQGKTLGALEQLRVNNFIRELMARNGGRLPKPKGGRPQEHPRRLRIVAEVLGEDTESTDAALLKVAARLGMSYAYVKECYYDPGGLSAARAERAFIQENSEIEQRRAEIARIAALPPLECERQIKQAANACGIEPSVLARVVKSARFKKLCTDSKRYEACRTKKIPS